MSYILNNDSAPVLSFFTVTMNLVTARKIRQVLSNLGVKVVRTEQRWQCLKDVQVVKTNLRPMLGSETDKILGQKPEIEALIL